MQTDDELACSPPRSVQLPLRRFGALRLNVSARALHVPASQPSQPLQLGASAAPQHPQLLVRPVDPVGPVARNKMRSVWAAADVYVFVCACVLLKDGLVAQRLELIGLI